MKAPKDTLARRIFDTALIIVVAVILAWLLRQTLGIPISLPTLEKGAGLGLVLLFGLLTSLHCLGMCGGLALTFSVGGGEAGKRPRRTAVLPPLLFNAGRVLSYTAVGAIVGGVGQVLSLSGFFKGLVPIAGGVFMVLMALHTLGLFPAMNRLQLGLPNRTVKKIRRGERGPFLLGLFMGIMPCGPLQMAETFALTTGSALYGAAAMFAFALGTVPSLFLLGLFGSCMGRRTTRAVRSCAAAVVIVLGVVMIGKGLAVNGFPNAVNDFMSPTMLCLSTDIPC